MDKVLAFLDQVPSWLQPIGAAVGIISIIAAGILMSTGSDGAQKGKKMIGYALMGVAVVFLASSIVMTIRGAAE